MERPVTDTSVRVRRRQRIEELCAASIRALTGTPDLHFRGQRLHRGTRVLPRFAPHLHPSFDDDDFDSFRGAADGLAMRLAHSDAALHARLCPAHAVERLLFDLLEQFRVEALAASYLPGLRRNLRHRFEQWSLAYHHSGLNESARGILLYATAQACRSRVSGEPPLALTEELIGGARGMISSRITHDLAALRRQRHDQAAYAVHALNIARSVGALMHSRDDERGSATRAADDTRSSFSLMFDLDGDEHEGFAVAGAGVSRVLAAAPDGYRVYTRAYDREVNAHTLVRRALLTEYRERLDKRIAAQRINLTRLARDLKALLATPAPDGWDGAQEEGVIDGRRLAQLVSSPAERRLFRSERLQPQADCLVSFLIDCSGSMKQHIETVAMLVDVFSRALELAGVCSEILGFTTGAWSGGRAQRDWQRAGRPAHPGRLNEVCHLVFKAADTPWRRARPAIAALLKPDLFREGIDGEAVEWACSRMDSRDEARRLLFVVSDGSPMDSATHLTNDQHYLDHHLREVVMRQEQLGRAAIFGIGVGLDLSPYYRYSHVLDLSATLSNRSFREILEMLAGSTRRRYAKVMPVECT
jgi:cobaltochelatase CobT